MGWWSTSVLGGDEPLDTLADIERIIGYTNCYPLARIEHPALAAAQLRDHLDDVVSYARKADSAVTWQVVGALAVTLGVRLDEDSLERVRDAALHDSWALSDPARAHHMTELVDGLDANQRGVRVTLHEAPSANSVPDGWR